MMQLNADANRAQGLPSALGWLDLFIGPAANAMPAGDDVAQFQTLLRQLITACAPHRGATAVAPAPATPDTTEPAAPDDETPEAAADPAAESIPPEALAYWAALLAGGERPLPEKEPAHFAQVEAATMASPSPVATSLATPPHPGEAAVKMTAVKSIAPRTQTPQPFTPDTVQAPVSLSATQPVRAPEAARPDAVSQPTPLVHVNQNATAVATPDADSGPSFPQTTTPPVADTEQRGRASAEAMPPVATAPVRKVEARTSPALPPASRVAPPQPLPTDTAAERTSPASTPAVAPPVTPQATVTPEAAAPTGDVRVQRADRPASEAGPVVTTPSLPDATSAAALVPEAVVAAPTVTPKAATVKAAQEPSKVKDVAATAPKTEAQGALPELPQTPPVIPATEAAPTRPAEPSEAIAPEPSRPTASDTLTPGPQMAEQLTSRIGLALQRGETAWRLKIRPPALGELDVRLTASGDGVTVQLRTETEAARGLLDSHLGELRHGLQERGVRLDSLEVNVVADRGFGGFSFGQPRSWQGPEGQPRATYVAPPNGERPAARPTVTAQRQRSAPAGRLDVLA